jgi:two-component system, LuxR family, sensor kinase FixL
MSWVTIIWSMVASACLTLAAIHFLVWCNKRTEWANLLFSLTAAATAILAACEFWMMRSETTGQFGDALRWAHVPTWAITLALVGFVRIYLRAGRPWLVWTICALRTLALLLNFLMGSNLNYREITGLQHVPFLGETVSVAAGVLNPWMLVGQLSLLLLLVFVADAAVTVWRRGDRRPAVVIGGSIVFFLLAGTVQTMLVFWQIVDWPVTPSLFFMPIVLAMGYETSRDVFHAAQMFDELRESETRFRSLANTAPVLIWMSGTDKLCNFFNQGWLDFTGRTLEQELGNGWADGVHPDDLPGCLKTYTESFDARRPFTLEYRLRRHDGEHRWISDHGVPRCDVQKKFLGYIGSCMDITERKQAEADSLRQRGELAHVARVSTMGELAASVAHELNQPLGAILANAEAGELFLKQDPPAIGELRAILADIRKDDERAGEVIRRMRALLRKHELEREPLEFNSVVADVLQVVSGDAALRNMVISADLAPVLPKILGDRIHLQQVVLNLILNGMDAMAGQPRERRRISVRTRSGADGGVELTVTDLGHGIEPDKFSRLFDPFFTTKPNGMGMGLSISRTILEAHRGKISAENNTPGGAVFRVTLPVASEETIS